VIVFSLHCVEWLSYSAILIGFICLA